MRRPTATATAPAAAAAAASPAAVAAAAAAASPAAVAAAAAAAGALPPRGGAWGAAGRRSRGRLVAARPAPRQQPLAQAAPEAWRALAHSAGCGAPCRRGLSPVSGVAWRAGACSTARRPRGRSGRLRSGARRGRRLRSMAAAGRVWRAAPRRAADGRGRAAVRAHRQSACSQTGAAAS